MTQDTNEHIDGVRRRLVFVIGYIGRVRIDTYLLTSILSVKEDINSQFLRSGLFGLTTEINLSISIFG